MDVLLYDTDVELLKEDFMRVYGYDFTGYSHASFKRRLQRLFIRYRYITFSEFRHHLLNDPHFFHTAVTEISVTVTEMFRDPSFFKTLRESVVPILATYPLIRIWHAGCSSGEEVYSMAILLKEAGVLHKSLLYATDINTPIIEKARKGIFPVNVMQQYSTNYLASGGLKNFSDYYSSNYNFAKFNEEFSKRMIFASHNLVSDSSFNSFQLILCRNVLIYFDKELQFSVLNVFDKSIEQLGFLALGSKESLRFSNIAGSYQQLQPKQKIWRKIK